MVVAVCLYGLFGTFISVSPFNFPPPSSAIRVALITCLSRFFCWCSFCVRLQRDLFFFYFLVFSYPFCTYFCVTSASRKQIWAQSKRFTQLQFSVCDAFFNLASLFFLHPHVFSFPFARHLFVAHFRMWPILSGQRWNINFHSGRRHFKF